MLFVVVVDMMVLNFFFVEFFYEWPRLIFTLFEVKHNEFNDVVLRRKK